MTSLSEFADQYLAEHLPPPREGAQPPTPTTPYIGNGLASPADRLDETASWADILKPHGWTQVKSPDTATLEAWRRPSGTSPVSAKVLKDSPYVLVNWSTDSGLPAGAGQKLTKLRTYAHLNYHGNESTTAIALLRGEAVGLPAHVVEACRGTTPPTREPTADGVAAPQAEAAANRETNSGSLGPSSDISGISPGLAALARGLCSAVS